ncbi:MAG: hypothetical protein ABJB93_12240, partial [Gaiellales bacterium]
MRRHAFALYAIFDEAYAQHWMRHSQALRERYLPDLDNVRAALDWASGATGDGELLIGLTGAAA